MPDPVHNLNDLMEEIEGASIETSAGRFIRVDHIRRLVEKRQAAAEEDEAKVEEEPAPTTWDQARSQAARYLKEELGAKPPNVGAGRSVPASDSQPPSRA